MSRAGAGTGAVCIGLAADADLWCLGGPDPALVGLFPDGLRAAPGALAEACARRLAAGPALPGQLFADLAATAAPEQVFAALDRLRGAGFLVAAADPACPGATSAPAAGQTVGDTLRAALADAGLCVWSGETAAPLRGAAWILPCRLADLGPGPLPPGAWLPVEITAERITAGPLFPEAGPQPCLTCLAARAGAHDDLGRLLAAAPGAEQVQSRRPPPDVLEADITFLRAAARAIPAEPPGTILLRWSRGAGVARARALPRGGCRDCGAPPRSLDLPAGAAAPLRAGGYRPLAAADLLSRLGDVVDPVTGIVRDLVPHPAADAARSLSQVVLARHAFPLRCPDLAATLRNRLGRSAGKGRRPEDGRVGAIAEALERYAGLARPGDAGCVAAQRDLDAPSIAPNDWMLFAPDQLADAARWRAAGEPAAHVPDPVTPDTPLDWTAVRDLRSGARAWAPAALCWHDFAGSRRAPGRADSNGCAAGQTPTDATLQGMLELVERDAVGIWWHRRARRPEIALRDLGDPWIDRLGAVLAGLGYSLAAQDLTHDLGACVVAAIAWPRGGRGPMLLGFGAHLAPATALSRALTELLQVLPDRPAEVVGGLPWAGLGRLPGRDPPDLSDFDFLRPSDGPGDCAPGPGLPPAPADAGAALEQLQQCIADAGLQVYVLDQSRPDVPLPVVRVIVPGLRHFRPRLAPGRLETLPARLGWTAQAGASNPCFIRQ